MNGGHGAVAGGANMFPKLFVDLYEAAKINDREKVAVLRKKLFQIEKKIYNVGKHTSKYIKTIKCALNEMKICNDFVAQPFRKFDQIEKLQIKQNLKELDFVENYQLTGQIKT